MIRKKLSYLRIFLICVLLATLGACNVPKSLIVKNAVQEDVVGVLMDYIFLNGYRVVDKDEERGLYLIYVHSQQVREYNISSDVAQQNQSTEQEIDPLVGPPFYTSHPSILNTNTNNITYKNEAVMLKNSLQNRAINSEEKEEFGVKIIQVNTDVRLSIHSTSQIYGNPGRYVYGVVDQLKENGYDVVINK